MLRKRRGIEKDEGYRQLRDGPEKHQSKEKQEMQQKMHQDRQLKQEMLEMLQDELLQQHNHLKQPKDIEVLMPEQQLQLGPMRHHSKHRNDNNKMQQLMP